MDATWLIIGIAIGGSAGWLIAWLQGRGAVQHERAAIAAQIAALETERTSLQQARDSADATIAELRTALADEQQARTAAQTQHEQTALRLTEHKQSFEQAEKQFKEAFAALSQQALRANSDDFAKRTEERVKPLMDALKRYEHQLTEMEKTRQTAYGNLTNHLEQLTRGHAELTQQTTTLGNALRNPTVKGRWGELTLRNAVELAGLSQHCDFIEQDARATDAGRLRPDLVVNLPGQRQIVVDAKAPVSDYLDAIAADNEHDRTRHLDQHAKRVREHLRSLGAKSYQQQFDQSPEFVVMFVPGEAFFSAALETDRDLIEYGLQQRVILASPTTLIALLRATSTSWQQADLVENAERIGKLAADLVHRIATFGGHLDSLGGQLSRAVASYNSAVGSFESRILPLHGRLVELGVPQQKEVSLKAVDVAPRPLTHEKAQGELPYKD